MILFDVPEVCAVQVVPSGEVRIVPELPTATNETLEVVSLESLFLAQEIIVRLKRDIRIMFKTLFIFSPISNERRRFKELLFQHFTNRLSFQFDIIAHGRPNFMYVKTILFRRGILQE